MIETEELSPTSFRSVLTPRQDRFEAGLVRAISSGGPRSAMRDAVHQLVDHLRLQGVPASRGLEIVMEVASRGSRFSIDAPRAHWADGSPRAPYDCLALVSEWASTRYGRAD